MSAAAQKELSIDQKIANVKSEATTSLNHLIFSVVLVVVFAAMQDALWNPTYALALGLFLVMIASAFVLMFKSARNLLSSSFTHRELLAKKYAR